MGELKIELEHKQLTSSRLTVNDTEDLVKQISDHQWSIDISDQDSDVCVYFEPWGIDPLIRFNGFLINKWLGNIEKQDHCLKFSINDSFVQRYREKDLQGRLGSLGTAVNDVQIDRVIGRAGNHDIVSMIKEKLIEKSRFS
jgi:hypothetical protein